MLGQALEMFPSISRAFLTPTEITVKSLWCYRLLTPDTELTMVYLISCLCILSAERDVLFCLFN